MPFHTTINSENQHSCSLLGIRLKLQDGLGASTFLCRGHMEEQRDGRTTSPPVDLHVHDDDARAEQIPRVLAGLEDLDMNEAETRIRDKRARDKPTLNPFAPNQSDDSDCPQLR